MTAKERNGCQLVNAGIDEIDRFRVQVAKELDTVGTCEKRRRVAAENEKFGVM